MSYGAEPPALDDHGLTRFEDTVDLDFTGHQFEDHKPTARFTDPDLEFDERVRATFRDPEGKHRVAAVAVAHGEQDAPARSVPRAVSTAGAVLLVAVVIGGLMVGVGRGGDGSTGTAAADAAGAGSPGSAAATSAPASPSAAGGTAVASAGVGVGVGAAPAGAGSGAGTPEPVAGKLPGTTSTRAPAPGSSSAPAATQHPPASAGPSSDSSTPGRSSACVTADPFFSFWLFVTGGHPC